MTHRLDGRTEASGGLPWTLFLLIMLTVVGCAGRPSGNLIPITTDVPGASTVDMLVTTTRSSESVPPSEMFNGERGHGLSYADIAISVPPDGSRVIGDVQWPSSPPGDPTHDFVTLRAVRLDQQQAIADFDHRLRKMPHRHVLVFVHGYNTRFEEAVYRFAQIVHDSRAQVFPLLFTWPSRGQLFDYVYDRESATYSRDALEAVLQAMHKDPNVKSISILAHSMGNFVAIEALRQMAIRNRTISPKIKDIMLAAPDVDVDVFRRQIAEIESSDKNPPVTLFISRDDHALDISRRLAGDEPRLGAVDPTVEPYRTVLEKANVNVIDLTKLSSNDFLNHSKFAQSDVVGMIGARLASGQTLSDAKPTFGERLGTITEGAAMTVGKAAALVVSAPESIVDGQNREALGRQAESFGATFGDTIKAPAGAAAP